MNMQVKWNAVENAADLGNPRADLRVGGAILFFFFVVLLGLAAIAPLDAGVHAQGVIAVSGNRQAVQHKEGGVVTAINVREGELVQAGEVLVEMAAPDVQASERALTNDYLTLVAQRARLVAEGSGAGRIEAPAEFATLPIADRALADQALQLQRQQLQARRASHSSQQAVIRQRALQLGTQQLGYAQQRASLREQQRIVAEELRGLREIARKGFASGTRVRALERAQEELRGREAAMLAEAARAGEGIGEARMQALTLKSRSVEEVAQELHQTQLRISDVLPKLVAAREHLQRTKVRAPATGQVVGLTVFTPGGVAAPGQILMEIVPRDQSLVVQAQVQPRDADDGFAGQAAQIRFTSVNDRSLPLLYGRVRTISADSFTDEKTGESYFRAEIEVSREELDRVKAVLGKGEIRAGLPAEVVLAVRKRTALEYLLEPLTRHFWGALREQ